MAVWLARAGAHGEREELALDQELAVIGWWELPDLSGVTSRDDLEALYREVFPDASRGLVANHVGQLWAFIHRIQPGDLVILPLKRRAAIAIGEVTGPYHHRPDLPEDARHTRPVRWLTKDMPRNRFDQDLLYSLGAFMTVCQIQRNNAAQRIRALLAGQPPPPRADGEGTDDEMCLGFIGMVFDNENLPLRARPVK